MNYSPKQQQQQQQQHNNTTTQQHKTLRSHFGSSRGHSWPGLSLWLPRHLLWVLFKATRAALHVWPGVGADEEDVEEVPLCRDVAASACSFGLVLAPRAPRPDRSSTFQCRRSRVRSPFLSASGKKSWKRFSWCLRSKSSRASGSRSWMGRNALWSRS